MPPARDGPPGPHQGGGGATRRQGAQSSAIARIDAGALELRRGLDRSSRSRGAGPCARRRGRGAHGASSARGRRTCRSSKPTRTLAEQAIGNVVANAIAHTPAATTVTIDAVVTPSRVALRVTDDGPGIAPEGAAARLRPGSCAVAASPTVPTAAEGTGLGLAIARGIMEAHGGRARRGKVQSRTDMEPASSLRFHEGAPS